MAANLLFLLDEVADEVLQLNGRADRYNTSPFDPKLVIAAALKELSSLKCEISNFVAFEGEASRMLTTVAEKYKKVQPVSTRVLRSTTEVGSLISEELLQCLNTGAPTLISENDG